MIDFNVGVSVSTNYEIKHIDSDYFNGELQNCVSQQNKQKLPNINQTSSLKKNIRPKTLSH